MDLIERFDYFMQSVKSYGFSSGIENNRIKQ